MNKTFLLIQAKNLAAIALPISAGRLINIAGNFIVMMMVAQYGKQQLAAGMLAVSSTIAVQTFASTIFYAIAIRIRYCYGQNQPLHTVGRLVNNSIWLALVIGIIAVLALDNMDKLLVALGQERELVSLAKGYFHYAALAMLPLLIMTIFGQFHIGIGKPRFALLVEAISLPLNLLIAYGTVSGHFGLPASGLAGVSQANLAVQSLMSIAVLISVYFQPANRPYQLFSNLFRIDWSICRSLLTLGLPIGLQFGGELSAMAAASYLMGYYGVDAMAALQISNQYSIIIIMLNFGLAQALSLVVSEAYGRQETAESIALILKAALLLFMLYMVPVIILFSTCYSRFAEFYLGVGALQPHFEYLIQAFFTISALFLILDGIRNAISSALRGLHDSRTASRINLTTLWLISLPASGLAVFVFNGSPVTLRLSFMSGFIVAVFWLVRPLTRHFQSSLDFSAA
ncbi:MATE family efflux transporter [Legionella dresdenensis]|uniref:MATE family efflux transporter n=1 Tax=Legionella dresdenensis TaxID=450200 RepID=A0ABV8CGH3_9GAMM